jgi:thiol-disulfide isomerase/thioredoxin
MMKYFLFAYIIMFSSQAIFSQPKINEAAPEISLPNLAGEIVNLSSFKGKVVIVDFWASWCGPCRKNNPHLLKFYKKYHHKGVEILGVSLDKDQDAWKAAVKQDKLEWVQLNDVKGPDGPPAIAYGVYTIPASFLIDKNGLIYSIDHIGWQLETEVRGLLKK